MRPASITCPRCGMTSHNPNDIRERYCGACHQYHDFMMTTYPCDLVFDVPVVDPRHSVLERAARELALSLASDGMIVRITARSPSDCYRLGQTIMALLAGAADPPLPRHVTAPITTDQA